MYKIVAECLTLAMNLKLLVTILSLWKLKDDLIIFFYLVKFTQTQNRFLY